MSRSRSTLPRRLGSPAGTALAVSAALAAAALYNTYRARQVERRYPPEGRFISVDGIRLHYLEKGSGLPIILLHGNGVMAVDYVLSGVFDRLTRNHRVIAFDRPGFGFSDRPRGSAWMPEEQAGLLRRACDRLDVGPAVVVGHSWGTLVALAMALNHPDRVRGLVLLSGFYGGSLRPDALLAGHPAIPVLGDVLRYTVTPLLTSALMPLLVRAVFAPRPVPRRFSRGYPYGMSVRPWQIRAEAQESATMMRAAGALRNRVHELSMPVAIMAGTEDHIVGHEANAVALSHDVPDAELHLIPGVGHMVHYAASDLVAAAIERVFVRTPLPRRSSPLVPHRGLTNHD